MGTWNVIFGIVAGWGWGLLTTMVAMNLAEKRCGHWWAEPIAMLIVCLLATAIAFLIQGNPS